MTNDRLNILEAAIAHQDHQIQDLSEMVNLQWKEIERLKRALMKAQDKIEEIAATSPDGTGNKSVTEIAASEKPPHY